MSERIDIRNDVDLATNLVACAYLACQAPTLPVIERRALCAVLNAAREILEGVSGALERDLI